MAVGELLMAVSASSKRNDTSAGLLLALSGDIAVTRATRADERSLCWRGSAIGMAKPAALSVRRALD